MQVALVVGSGYPERHAVGKVDGSVTQLVLVCRVQGFHGLAAIEQLAESSLGLVAGIIIVLIQPECGARQIRDDVARGNLNRRGLGTLHRCNYAHDSGTGIHHFLHDLSQHRGVGNTKTSGYGRVRYVFDMFLCPHPDILAVGWSPRFTPQVFQIFGFGHNQGFV